MSGHGEQQADGELLERERNQRTMGWKITDKVQDSMLQMGEALDQYLTNYLQSIEQRLSHLEQQSQLQQQEASKGTQRLSRDTEPTADLPSTSNTSFEWYFLAKEEPTGEWLTMATVMFHEPSFIETLGAVLKYWPAERYKLIPLPTSAQLLLSGLTQSATPAGAAAGPIVGGSDETTFAP